MEAIFYPLDDPTYDPGLLELVLERFHGLTVCDHVRDFKAGLIINNIEHAITTSRRIIVLLSK